MTNEAARAALSTEVANEEKTLPAVPSLHSAEAEHVNGGVPGAPSVTPSSAVGSAMPVAVEAAPGG
jgi:chemotaxis protein MotB